MMKHSHDTRSRNRSTTGGFTLVEMLLAIFILGIGVISIAALFPVGLTQQRRSTDAIVGPTVANDAVAVLKSKLSASDFGFFDDSGNIYNPFSAGAIGVDPLVATIWGDTTWRRPAFFFNRETVTNQAGGGNLVATAGSIDVFRDTNSSSTELPYNIGKWGASQPPQIIFTQEERFWPQQPSQLIDAGTVASKPPQYVWDCAFRRFQGRIQVAIFVYRVGRSGASTPTYAVAQPLPYRNLLDGSGVADDPWDIFGGDGQIDGNEAIIPDTDPTFAYDPANFDHGWQAPGQWLLDQNNTIMRVLAGRRNVADGPVELTRPVPGLPFLRPYFFIGNDPDVPTSVLWYIPPVDSNGWRLTPIYATVRDFE